MKREEIFINAPPANKRIDLKSLAYPQIEQNWQWNGACGVEIEQNWQWNGACDEMVPVVLSADGI